ncbi:hypothetical protein RN001_000550 [Aquatica leii]|uniref:SHSP domain-containing protein n=1 Tax=Aquatica leii TaxID=1421715 RepID=A0AAN7SKM6_9COLE|nr:hypothetical protein RN001_000550 [Aquatica leii]
MIILTSVSKPYCRAVAFFDRSVRQKLNVYFELFTSFACLYITDRSFDTTSIRLLLLTSTTKTYKKMSMVPMLFRDWWDDVEFNRPHRLLDQQFGTTLNRDELINSFSNFPRYSLLSNRYFRPWRTEITRQDSGSTIAADKEKFQIILDVQQFSPNEIVVKTNNDSIIVEGKHEEKQDEHGFISRHFVRRYLIPQDHDIEGVISSLSSDGVLTISAPKKGAREVRNERIVPITQTGPSKPTITEEK